MRHGPDGLHPRRGAAIATVLLVLAAVAHAGGPPRAARESPAVRRADAAIAELRDRLLLRLIEELERGGAAGAVRVCRDEAQRLTAAIAEERDVEVGRTSHRLRNPHNAPRAWAASHVAASAGLRASEAEPLVVDLGDRVGLLRPIPAGALCLRCHGAAENLDPEVVRLLRASYPGDRATGFAEGDLRGFFWAEVSEE